MVTRNANPGNAGALPSFGLDPVGSTGNTAYAPPVDEGGRDWGRMLQSVSGVLGDWAERSAEVEAREAGAMAGLEPDYKFREGGPLLANAAFHAAALKTHSHALDTKMRAAQEDALAEWERLPVDQRTTPALQKALDARKKAFAADVFDPERPAFETNWASLSQTALAAANRDVYKRTIDEARAATLANGDAISMTAHRVASLPTSSDADLSRQVQEYERVIDAAVNQNQITAVQAQEAKSRFRQSVLATRTLAMFDGLPPDERAAAVENFRNAYGGGDYLTLLKGKESGADPNIKNPRSTATGLYQFTEKTWDGLRRAHPELGLTAAGRTDPAQQEKAVRVFTAENAAALKAVGHEATPANLYMAHFLGAGRAVKFLDALERNPNAQAAALFPQEAAANPEVFTGRTLGEVYALQTKRFQGPRVAGLQPETYTHVLGQMERRVMADAHEAERARREAGQEINAAKRQIIEGYDLPATEWSRLSAAYAGSPDAETRAAFLQAEKLRGMLAGFVGKPAGQVEAQIAAMQAEMTDGGTPEQIEAVAAASKWLATYRKDIANDPVQRYARDFGKAPPPLDFSSPDALAASMTGPNGRLSYAEQAAKAYGLPAPRLLLESERAAFKTLAANGGPAMAQAAGAVMRALGPRGADLLREIGGDAPAFAQAARVSAWGGDKGFIDDFAEWHRLSSDPAMRKALELPKRDVADAELSRAYGQALAALPELGAAARTATIQTYELRALRNGWDRSLNDAAAREALGRTAQEALGATFVGDAQYGGVAARKVGWMARQQVLAPGNLRADRFDDALAAITDADLKANPPLHSENRPASAATVKSGWLLSVGRGKYEVYDRDPLSKDARPLRAKDGAPWVLDMNALEEKLRARVPGAWK